jgi:hypothetical protein
MILLVLLWFKIWMSVVALAAGTLVVASCVAMVEAYLNWYKE